MRWKWAKLLLNLTNAVEAVCGREARSGPLLAIVRREGEDVLRAAGSLGVLHGVATPLNDVLVRHANALAAAGNGPGSVPVDQIVAEAGIVL
jgi:hypothetical protein